ncbi:aminotransferase class V-fold PLP-dependent enzyme [Treponema denticola]|uniref:DegT/DnrJ/EryC1/StrS aminotransferase n=1 Tax=Treponema denticola H-22 TaxID=999432 RepID=A0A0E2E820_TREDN|nr:aminotransferase class V-fold PLP-dependent enzyme [Treponema denticola]EMB36015.1 hypothetical protein HMPREF9726_00207 [Treponema denticola H-22]
MIPLFQPYMPEHILEDPEFKTLIYSGYLINGPYKKLFTDALAEFIGNKNIILCSSFFDAQSIIIKVLGLKADDEVILSPLSCLRSSTPFAFYGLNIVWADIDPDTGTLDPESVKKLITKDTKLIVHNQHLGYVGYIDEINAIGKLHGIPVLDDCLDGIGGIYKGKNIGNCGTDFTIASFDPVRLPNAVNGACIITRKKETYNECLAASDLYIDRAEFRLDTGEINPNYDITKIGLSSSFSEINAYLGYKQMVDLKLLLSKRLKNAKVWDKFLKNNIQLGGRPIENKDGIPNYWVYGFRTKSKEQMYSYFKLKNCEISEVHFPNHNYSIFNNKHILHGVDEFYNTFLALPCGWWKDININ